MSARVICIASHPRYRRRVEAPVYASGEELVRIAAAHVRVAYRALSDRTAPALLLRLYLPGHDRPETPDLRDALASCVDALDERIRAERRRR
jgi:hypothetical protein